MSTETQGAGTTTTPPPPAGAAGAAPPAGGASLLTDAGTNSAAGATPPAGTEGTTKSDAGGDAAKAQEPAPADVTVTLPEGMKDDKAFLDSFLPVAKEAGLKSEAAQKFVDLIAKRQAAFVQSAQERWKETTSKTWVEQAKTDKEIGGSAFESNLGIARRAISKFADDEAKAFFDQSGVGNHPALIRLFHRIGKALAEDSVAGSTGGAPGITDEEAALRARYPSMFPQE